MLVPHQMLQQHQARQGHRPLQRSHQQVHSRLLGLQVDAAGDLMCTTRRSTSSSGSSASAWYAADFSADMAAQSLSWQATHLALTVHARCR